MAVPALVFVPTPELREMLGAASVPQGVQVAKQTLQFPEGPSTESAGLSEIPREGKVVPIPSCWLLLALILGVLGAHGLYRLSRRLRRRRK